MILLVENKASLGGQRAPNSFKAEVTEFRRRILYLALGEGSCNERRGRQGATPNEP